MSKGFSYGLSTLFTVFILTSLLLGLNLRPREVIRVSEEDHIRQLRDEYGFPFCAYSTECRRLEYTMNGDKTWETYNVKLGEFPAYLNIFTCILDIGISIILICGAGLFSEYRFRKSQGRQKEFPSIWKVIKYYVIFIICLPIMALIGSFYWILLKDKDLLIHKSKKAQISTPSNLNTIVPPKNPVKDTEPSSPPNSPNPPSKSP